MVNWTIQELELVDNCFYELGARGLRLMGVSKTSLEILEKALELGKDLDIKKIKLDTKDDYVEAIKRGYVLPKGWTKEELDILLNYFPIGSYNLCVERGLNKNMYHVNKLATYLNLYRKDRSLYWKGVKLVDLIDAYDTYGISKCYSMLSDIKENVIDEKISEYRVLNRNK